MFYTVLLWEILLFQTYYSLNVNQRSILSTSMSHEETECKNAQSEWNDIPNGMDHEGIYIIIIIALN